MDPGRVLRAILVISTYLISISVTRAQSKGRRYRSSGGVNILFVRASSVRVGFVYVEGVTKYYVNAREWVGGRSVGNEAFGIWLNSRKRSTTLHRLNPAREYLIRVQAYTKNRPIGSLPQKVVRTSQQCYICNAMPGNELCKVPGKEFDCPHDKDACLNEVRYSKGVPTITKRCAQWRPELGRQIQNGNDVTMACTGRENIKDVTCKCMCKSNLCNKVEVPCFDECFTELPTPTNSYIKCTESVRVGSVCTWLCLPGYKIKGTSRSVCRRDRTWSVLNPPVCVGKYYKPSVIEPHQCPDLEPPEKAFMECTNGNNLGSVCTFKCFSNNILRGSSEMVCDGYPSKWSGLPASCEELTCSTIQGWNGLTKECTNGEAVGSVCDFSCPENKKFMGSRRLICQPAGRWSSGIPKCVEHDCSILPMLFDNVLMECYRISYRRNITMCSFSCTGGYEIVGPSRSFCYEGNSWTNNPPTCQRIRCQPQQFAPRNGFVQCSNRDFYGSVCTFSCDFGYSMRGPQDRTCRIRDWSEESPICKPVRCPAIRLINGIYWCHQGQNLGSICRFSCFRGFGLVEGRVNNRLRCVGKSEEELSFGSEWAMLGRWSSRVPRCVVIRCPQLGAVPDNADRKCTSDSNTVDTVCTYMCDSGYKMTGPSRTTCVAGSYGGAKGEWSHQQPFCRRITCIPVAAIANGDVNCTNGEFAGSVCIVACSYGYELRGKNPVRCSSDGLWSRRLPDCTIVTCTGVPTLINGRYFCGRGLKYDFNQECEAKCDDGFELSMPGKAVCDVEGSWLTSDEVRCHDVNECEVLDEEGTRTNGFCEQICVNTVGSYYCNCKDDYILNEDGRNCTRPLFSVKA